VTLHGYTDYTDYTEKNGFSHGKSVHVSERSIRQIRVRKVFITAIPRDPEKISFKQVEAGV
jgi:hypothetical protein